MAETRRTAAGEKGSSPRNYRGIGTEAVHKVELNGSRYCQLASDAGTRRLRPGEGPELPRGTAM